MAETRKGFAFNNPDTTSSYHAPKFGFLVHPDELRYDELFGNPLIAEADSMTYTDEQLADYVRQTIAVVERELNIDILPRRIRYSDRIGSDGNEIERLDIKEEDSKYLSQMKTNKQKNSLYIRESGYPYRIIQARHEARIKLRRRPARKILSAKFVDPNFGNTVIDLMPYRIFKGSFQSVLYFRPNLVQGRGYGFNYIWQTYLLSPYYRDLQDLFLIDYETGYANAEDVPDELRYIIKKISAILLMATFGDGKMSSIASRSVNLNSVSEAISTTMSATSAAFGARILQYKADVKDWFAKNTQKYSNTSIGCL